MSDHRFEAIPSAGNRATITPVMDEPRTAGAAPEFLIGLDLGQASDYTGLVVVERSRLPSRDWTYAVRAIERLPLGTRYPAVVEYTGAVVRALRAQRPQPLVYLVADYTGVGRPVADMLLSARLDCSVALVTITGSDAVTEIDGREFRVPKRDLASTVQVLLQSGRLKISKELPLATTLTNELTGFRVKINLKTGHDSYGAGEDWRSAPHDDLVLALALSCWFSEAGNARLIWLW